MGNEKPTKAKYFLHFFLITQLFIFKNILSNKNYVKSKNFYMYNAYNTTVYEQKILSNKYHYFKNLQKSKNFLGTKLYTLLLKS